MTCEAHTDVVEQELELEQEQAENTEVTMGGQLFYVASQSTQLLKPMAYGAKRPVFSASSHGLCLRL